MDTALKRSANKAIEQSGTSIDWRKRMSDNVAFALLIYTGLQIGVTMAVLKGNNGSILPYFALVLLVAAIIPAARLFEARWSELNDEQAADPSLSAAFTRDRIALWLCALGMPFALAAFFKGVATLLG
jgi:hypothetical protein